MPLSEEYDPAGVSQLGEAFFLGIVVGDEDLVRVLRVAQGVSLRG